MFGGNYSARSSLYRGWRVVSTRRANKISALKIFDEKDIERSRGEYDGDFTHEFLQGAGQSVVDGLINLNKEHLKEMIEEIEFARRNG